MAFKMNRPEWTKKKMALMPEVRPTGKLKIPNPGKTTAVEGKKLQTNK
tara:strand:+ start:1691 stop:1834 length:144 start_codon:yes stop_codon:yes gene_type:complete